MNRIKIKGFVEIGPHILLMLILTVGIIAFIMFFMASAIDQYEEQQFLSSVTGLAYSMDYVCKTGQTRDVEINFPQKIVNAENWISGMGDPKYMVYYEKFPPGEEWSWTSHQVNDLRGMVAESVVFALVPYAIGKGASKIAPKLGYKLSGKGIYEFAREGKTALQESRSILDDVWELGAKSKMTHGVAQINVARILEKSGKERGVYHSGILKRLGDMDDDVYKNTLQVFSKRVDDALVKRDKLFDAADEAYKGGKIDKTLAKEITRINKNVEDNLVDGYQIPHLRAELSSFSDKLPPGTDGLKNAIREYDESLDEMYKFYTDGAGITTSEDAIAFGRALKYAMKRVKFYPTPKNFIISEAFGKGIQRAGVFVFNHAASPLDRANEKFSYCGLHSLCAKTPDAIYIFKLKSCELNDVDYVMLDKGSGVVSKETSFWSKLAGHVMNLLSFGKDRRFYLASPCGQKFRVELKECDCPSDVMPVYRFGVYTSGGGEKEYRTEIAGYSRECEKGGDTKVKCLWVKEIRNSELPAYGDNGEYKNFCFSSPEGLKHLEETGWLIGTVALDIGLSSLTGGLAIPAIGFATNMIYGVGTQYTEARYLWPNRVS